MMHYNAEKLRSKNRRETISSVPLRPCVENHGRCRSIHHCLPSDRSLCSSVCMSKMFMPVDVVMPSRSKRRSVRCLISGFTRKAIVAEFIGMCTPLFNRCVDYVTYCCQKQAA